MDSSPDKPSPPKPAERAVRPVPDAVETGPPPTPEVATTLFGERLHLAERYVALLADTGLSHGLMGPRERPRLWDRHVLGCAVLTDVIAEGHRVVDVGSGAGLPGLVMAIRRPDLEVMLVEPLHRRVVWLEDAVAALGLGNVTVHEGRAESRWGESRVEVVTARAVARIGVLARWSLPLLEGGGHLLALKGSSARTELTEDEAGLRSAGAVSWGVSQLGVDLLDPPATLVTVGIGDHAVTVTRGRSRSATVARPSTPPRKRW